MEEDSSSSEYDYKKYTKPFVYHLFISIPNGWTVTFKWLCQIVHHTELVLGLLVHTIMMSRKLEHHHLADPSMPA